MSQFRSEKMELIQLFIQSEAAHGTLHELGEVGAVQFKDLNIEKSAFQRLFVSDVRRCDDMLRILRIFADSLAKEKMPPRADKALSPGSVVELHEKLTELEKEIKVPSPPGWHPRTPPTAPDHVPRGPQGVSPWRCGHPRA